MYNHSEQPNLVYVAENENEVIWFKARCDIQENQQLTIHYEQEADGSYAKSGRWFVERGIKSLDVTSLKILNFFKRK